MIATLTELIDEWCRALESEIEAVGKSGGSSSRVEVTGGRLVGTANGQHLYEFEADRPINLPDDGQVELRIGGQAYPGSVVACSQYVVTLALNADLGDAVGRATITSDLTYLLQRLADEWRRVRDGGAAINEAAILKLLSPVPGSCGRQPPSPLSSRPDVPPNPAQAEAVAASLGNDTTFIWGPPGTGKTRTLAWVAEAFLSRGMSVLVSAHTNVATDRAILDVAGTLSQSLDLACRELLEQGLILRFGTPQLEEVCPGCKTPGEGAEHSPICARGALDRKGAGINQQLEEIEEGRKRCETLIREKQEGADFWERYDTLKLTTTRAADQIETLGTQRDHLAVRLSDLEAELARLTSQVDEAEHSGRLKRMLRGLNPEKLRNQRDRCLGESRAAGATLEGVAQQLAQTESLLEETKTELDACEPRARELRLRGEDPATLRGALDEQHRVLGELGRRAVDLRARLQSLEKELIDSARLVACTLTKSFLNADVSGRQFDAVIVDEASMAPIPAICYAAGLSASRVVIVGDFRQLAPIAVGDNEDNTDAELVRNWLRRDIFDHAGVIDRADDNALEDDQRIAPLTSQYRMHPDIARVCNDVIYGGLLLTMTRPPFAGLGSEPFPNHPLVLVDTSSVNPWCTHDPNKSRYNVYSAVVAVELARQALDSDPTGNLKVGITCAYKAQANLIRSLARSKGLSRDSVEVANVHRYQGNERDVMIYDTVDGPRLGIGLPQRDRAGTDARRLINVAVTRPKSKLIIIANHRYAAEHLRREDTLHRVLGMAADAFVEDSTEVVQSYFHPDVRAAYEAMGPQPLDIDLDKTLIVTDREFWHIFINDLFLADRRVIVFSPFTAQNRIDKLVDPLRISVDRGVAVYVVTRPPTGQMNLFGEDPHALLSQLREAGVQVIYHYRGMHEKLAIIDDEIAWLGSLNILAHGAGSEMMIRVPDRTVVAEIKRLWDIGRLIADAGLAPQRDHNRAEFIGIATGHAFCDRGHAMGLKFNGNTHEPFYACPVCEHVTKRVPRALLTDFIAGLGLACCDENCAQCGQAPCHGQLCVRTGQGGRVFLGCGHHPNCTGTRGLRYVF